MLIKRFVVENYGVYRGRHELLLEPKSSERPIVLIGGLNGAGKTTLLDGLRLCLYGKRARLNERDKGRYKEYLRRAIHRHANPFEGASVELEFDHYSMGRRESLRVVRSWSAMGEKVYENVEVYRDGELDRVASDGWEAEVEQIMPLAISELFFFDGERVRRFTESGETAEMLMAAMTHLMGVGLVAQLGRDLDVLAAKTRRGLGDGDDNPELNEAQQQLEATREELDALQAALEHAREAVEQRRAFYEGVDASFRRMGGEEYERRAELEAEGEALDEQREGLLEELRAEARGVAPLGLLDDLLREASDIALAEVEYQRFQVVRDLLVRRDDALVEHLDGAHVDEEVVDTVRAFLAEDRRRRAERHRDVEPFLDVDAGGCAELRRLSHEALPEAAGRLEQSIAERDRLDERAASLKRRLERVPDDEVIQEVLEKRRRARRRLDKAELEVRQLEEERARLIGRVEQIEARIDRYLRERIEAGFDGEDSARVLIYATKIQSGLDRFRLAMLRRKLGVLERLVVEGFQQLARKDELLANLKIDPDTFELSLVDRAGEAFSPEVLSAGERQLLSIAMLWGLARCTGRQLPTVIDTPLGRLDSKHRRNLTCTYFPRAGRQVILLSTDEEIVGDLRASISPAISRQYRLEFESEEDATRIEEGYFSR